MKNLTTILLGISIIVAILVSGCIKEIESEPPEKGSELSEKGLYYYAETGEINQTQASAAWSKVNVSDEAKFVASEKSYSAVVFMHPYTVGIFDPSTAEWIAVMSFQKRRGK